MSFLQWRRKARPITISRLGGSLRMRHIPRSALTLIALSTLVSAQTPEQRTARYLDSIRNQPSLLLAFLHDMPKGGDLHNHLDGALYAEDVIDWAASDNLCIDRTTSMHRLSDAAQSMTSSA